MALRVVFLGSPEFAVPSLDALARASGIQVPLVVTQPDRPAGRGRALQPPAVKRAAERLGLSLYQPASLREPEAAAPLHAARPDLLVVVAYGELLRRHVLDLTPAGCLNVHPSLLPRYRGAAPIPAAILAGDMTTGVSLIRLVRRLDAGPIVTQQIVDITPDDTTGTLGSRLAVVAADMLQATVAAYLAGTVTPVPQDDTLATYTREWTTDDARLDWSQPALQLDRLVRAANPWPMAWTTLDGQRLRIVAARSRASADSDSPGVITSDRDGVFVATGTGVLELLQVQPAGKRVMPAVDWWRGLRVRHALLGH